MDPILPTNVVALVAIAAIGVATRYFNAALTDETAPDWVTGGIAYVLAGLGALSVWLADVDGVPDWRAALVVFVGALVTTKAVQAVDLGLEPKLKRGGLHIGAGHAGERTATP